MIPYVNKSWFWVPAILWAFDALLYLAVDATWLGLFAPALALVAWYFTIEARKEERRTIIQREANDAT